MLYQLCLAACHGSHPSCGCCQTHAVTAWPNWRGNSSYQPSYPEPSGHSPPPPPCWCGTAPTARPAEPPPPAATPWRSCPAGT
jgi:hypothetical protein